MREELFKMMEKEGVLPPFPEIIARLREMIEDPDVGINEVAKVIQSDPILTGKLIQLANSVYGGGSAFFATDLNRALSRLGLKMAMDLAYSLKLSNMFNQDDYIDKTNFWRYSLALAVISSRIAKGYGARQEEMSYAYLGGLMRNLGALFFSSLIPTEYGKLLGGLRKKLEGSPKRRKLMALEPLEEKAFGVSSAELTGFYIRRWWSVEQPVLDYIECRSKILLPEISQVVEIARYFLAVEGIEDGILDLQVWLPEGYFEKKLGISPEQYKELQFDLQESLSILS